MRTAVSFVILMAATTLSASQARAQDTRLTILQDGRVLVRRSIEADVPAGASTHRLELGVFDVGSVFSLDPDVQIVALRHTDGMDTMGAMARGIGRDFQVTTPEDTVVATLLGVEPMRWRWPNGTVSYGPPRGTLLFPPDLVPAAPELIVTVDARARRRALALAYMREGATWAASYSVTFDDDEAVMRGLATITSERIAVDSVEVTLLAGSVSRAGGPSPRPMMARALMEAGQPQAELGAVGVGDVHVYPLPRPVTLVPGEATGVALLASTPAEYRRRYVASGGLPWTGSLGGAGGEADFPVRVTYQVKRPAGSALGDRALPGGVVRMYRRDPRGRLNLIGESAMPHAPAGRDLELDAGLAFDLTGKRWMTDFQQVREDNRRAELAAFAVTLANGGDTDATIEVVERRRGEWSVLESSLPGERVSATEVRFVVAVPAGSETTFTYRLKVYP